MIETIHHKQSYSENLGWLSKGFTSQPTQNKSFPSQSLGLVLNYKFGCTFPIFGMSDDWDIKFGRKADHVKF